MTAKSDNAPESRRCAAGRKTSSSARSGWHYIAKGDYPPRDMSVLVQCADLSEWAKDIVKNSARSSIGLFLSNSRYRGHQDEIGLDLWEGIPLHCAVTAWKTPGADPMADHVKKTIFAFQDGMSKNDMKLGLFLASAYRVNPEKNRSYIEDLIRKFRKHGRDFSSAGLVNHEGTREERGESPVFIDGSTGRIFSVEGIYGHGVIVQAERQGMEMRYARDFPKYRRIYPTESDARLALVAEADRQKWRRCS